MSGSIDIPVISKFDPNGLKQAQNAVQGFGKGLKAFAGVVAGAFAVSAVTNFVKEAIQGAEVAEQFNNRIRAVAAATGIFGTATDRVTDSLIKFADSQEMVIGQEAEIIKGVQAQLLSFKKLSVSAGETGGVFERVTKAAFDMAAAGFGSAESNAIALGKAFEDPIRGLTALRRSGTVFTEEQQALIKTLVQTGDTLGAQEIILQELETQYGGTAEATALWSDKLRLSFDAVKDAIGIALLPAFEQFAMFLMEDVLPPIQTFFEEDFPRILQTATPIVEAIGETFMRLGEILKEALGIGPDLSLLEGLLQKIAQLEANPEFQEFVAAVLLVIEQMLPLIVELVPLFAQLTVEIIPLLVEILPQLISLLAELVPILTAIADLLGNTLGKLYEWQDMIPDWLVRVVPMLDPIRALADAFRSLRDMIEAAIAAWNRFKGLNVRAPGGSPGGSTSSGGGRADGGMVTGGTMYAVGERGPEMFIPNQNGTIIPNNALGGGGIVVNVNAGMGVDGARLGEQIVNAIKRYERASGPVFASA